MRVTQLTLRDFRTYASADVRFAPGPHGRLRPQRRRQDEPARGRSTSPAPGARAGPPTSASACASGRSSRAWSCAARTPEGAHEVTVGFRPGEPKRLRVDGAPVERLTDVRARPLVSVFLPDRLELVTGAPALRRAHLDQVVAALRPGARRDPPRLRRRARPAQRAHRGDPRRPRGPRLPAGLGRRAGPPRHRADGGPRGRRRGPRAALRRPRGGPRAGGRRPRSPTGRARAPRPRRRWPPSWPSGSPADLERGFTGHGPHRDDLVLRREGRDLRAYGSRGQQRLGLLALLLAEREALAEARAAPAAAPARRRHERARRGPPPPARRRARRGRPERRHHDRPRARARRRGRRRRPARHRAGHGARRRRRRDGPGSTPVAGARARTRSGRVTARLAAGRRRRGAA